MKASRISHLFAFQFEILIKFSNMFDINYLYTV